MWLLLSFGFPVQHSFCFCTSLPHRHVSSDLGIQATIVGLSAISDSAEHGTQRADEGLVRIHVQITIHPRLRIGRDGHLDQSKDYDIS